MTRPLRISKPSKYLNQRWEYGGRTYHSKLEAHYAKLLDALKEAVPLSSRVTMWQPQVNTPIFVNGQHICDYRIDFAVTYGDGRIEWVECKGMPTPLGELKMKLFKACYPDRILKVIK
jgi:Protein of unknown function (DUF1064)